MVDYFSFQNEKNDGKCYNCNKNVTHKGATTYVHNKDDLKQVSPVTYCFDCFNKIDIDDNE